MDPNPPSPGSALFDDSRWPLLVVRMPGPLSNPGHEAFLDTLGAYLRRGERFVVLVDVRLGLMPLEQRWRQVEWNGEHECLLVTYLMGAALIITSPIVQLSLRSILHFKRLALPIAVFRNWDGACAWAHQRLREAGLSPPPDES